MNIFDLYDQNKPIVLHFFNVRDLKDSVREPVLRLYLPQQTGNV